MHFLIGNILICTLILLNNTKKNCYSIQLKNCVIINIIMHNSTQMIKKKNKNYNYNPIRSMKHF
jgi:hypothetical protein